MSKATIAGTGSSPASQRRTSLGHTPSFRARTACPQAMRRSSRFSCVGDMVEGSTNILRSRDPERRYG